jgi:hypothetical protein
MSTTLIPVVTHYDLATHFIRNNGTHAGAYQFEYAPSGSGSGRCVSDPGGGWKSDPLRDGLILTSCNSGPFQQFVLQSNGTLRNLATGLYVNPNGTGSQLRGEGPGGVPPRVRALTRAPERRDSFRAVEPSVTICRYTVT